MPIKRRLPVLVLASALGAVLLLPAATAGSPDGLFAGVFVGAAAVTCGLSTWAGLRLADEARLPMPLLRSYEHREPLPVDRAGFRIALVSGIVVGLLSLGVTDMVGGRMAGPVLARTATVLFAAVTLEVVVHLFLMSFVIWLLGGHVWVGILVSAAAFVGFHAVGAGAPDAAYIMATAAANGAAAVVFGWLYATYGFEYLVLAHGVAHLIAVVPG